MTKLWKHPRSSARTCVPGESMVPCGCLAAGWQYGVKLKLGLTGTSAGHTFLLHKGGDLWGL